jgi:hypothetical protein
VPAPWDITQVRKPKSPHSISLPKPRFTLAAPVRPAEASAQGGKPGLKQG